MLKCTKISMQCKICIKISLQLFDWERLLKDRFQYGLVVGAPATYQKITRS